MGVLKLNDISYTGGSGGGSSTLSGLSDVDITTPSNGQVLTYDSSSQEWINSNSSGGSGGHTILDDDGTSLTQRSKLQFKGAYSEDNSTDNTTEVNVVRSMTKAEFDLLSDDEKVGIIDVTDVTGGAEDKFQPVIYSLEEREIGVWIDGKPLYERTIILRENRVDKYPYSNYLYDVGLTGVDKVWLTGIYAKRGSPGNTEYIDIISNSDDVVIVFKHTDGSIYVRDNFDPTDIIVIVRYTKSTDQAGSGQWTPQGVPAVHYSTDEQVVGTWIDGKTLYQKVVSITSGFSASMTVAHNISNLGEIVEFKGVLSTSSGYFENINDYTSVDTNYLVRVGDFSSTNFTITIGSARLAQTSKINVIIRYTKSST